MKRLIYAEDAMRRIKSETRFYSGTYAEIERAIDSAPTIEPNRPSAEWVSVEDRLPEMYESVLIHCGNCTSIAWRTSGNNGGWHWSSRMSYSEEMVDTDYWMPLPNPPDEVSDNG